MSSIKNKIWDLFQYRNKQLLIWGLKNKKVSFYGEKLLKKLRTIYYGGLPASIILLSDGLSNGYCYDRALLMAKAFIDDPNIDVNLIYASIDSLRLNPKYKTDDPMFADHCVVEIKDSKDDYIIDTSSGFIYDKKLYWLMEHPKVRKINNKQAIIDFYKQEEELYPDDIENDKYATPLILPNIELCFGRPNEMYSVEGIEMLQHEIDLFKKEINYDELVKEINEDMKRLGFIKG